MDELEKKVLVLTKDVEHLKTSNDRLWNDMTAMRSDLDELVKILNQIRWMGVGAFMFFLASEIGIIEAIKQTLKFL